MLYKTFLDKDKSDLRAIDFKDALASANMTLQGAELKKAKAYINGRFRSYLKDKWFEGIPDKYFGVMFDYAHSTSYVGCENKFRTNVKLLREILKVR